MGIVITIAITLHNIPEGVSVAMQYIVVQEINGKLLGCSLFSGLAEPLGLIIVCNSR